MRHQSSNVTVLSPKCVLKLQRLLSAQEEVQKAQRGYQRRVHISASWRINLRLVYQTPRLPENFSQKHGKLTLGGKASIISVAVECIVSFRAWCWIVA